MNALWLLLYIIAAIIFLAVISVNDNFSQPDNNEVKTWSVDETDIAALLLIVAFSLLCATRSEHSYDTFVYKSWFLQVVDMPFWNVEGSYGRAFEFISKAIGFITDGDFRWYLFVFAFLNNLVVYRVLRKTAGVGAMGYILYSSFLGFYYGFAVLRQGLAITFVIWALASSNKKIKMFVLLSIAVLSHNTAIVVLIAVIALQFIKIGNKGLLMIWSIAFFNYLVPVSDTIIRHFLWAIKEYIPDSMQGRFELYFTNADFSRSVSLYYLFYFFVLFLIILLSFNSIGAMKESNTLLNLGVWGLMLMSIGLAFPVVIRLSDYFIPVSIIFLTPSCLRSNLVKGEKTVITAMCSIALLLYLRVFLSYSPLFI